jgi:hypothetical protein
MPAIRKKKKKLSSLGVFLSGRVLRKSVFLLDIHQKTVFRKLVPLAKKVENKK